MDKSFDWLILPYLIRQVKSCHQKKLEDLRRVSFLIAVYCIGVSFWDLSILAAPYSLDHYKVCDEDTLYDTVTMMGFCCVIGGILMILIAIGFMYVMHYKNQDVSLKKSYTSVVIITMSFTNLLRILYYITNILRMSSLEEHFDGLNVHAYNVYLGLSIFISVFSAYYCYLLKIYSFSQQITLAFVPSSSISGQKYLKRVEKQPAILAKSSYGDVQV